MHRPPVIIAAFTLLTACPWISDHNPDGDEDTDTLPDVDTTCDDVDWDGVCDADDRCVDGVDDTIDLIAVGPGETISGRVCGDQGSAGDGADRAGVNRVFPLLLGFPVYEMGWI